MTGKVWLVGAGPSDLGLLTLKGKYVIEHADVVIYDRLVGQSILTMVPEIAESIDVGKKAGNHKLTQNEINQLILEKAKSGKKVVRLKGGDPFLFGRGAEEIELLIQNDIPYEIVPGITSALAVPAYNGIAVTHRNCCSSVHILTGHKKNNEYNDIDFNSLVNMKGTLVFLMGVAELGYICDKLIEAGMRDDMPAAFLQNGTSSKQKRIVATVGTLESKVSNSYVETPAIIIVGEVCKMNFEWYEKLPLFGCKIIVTRPKQFSSSISNRLRELGAEVLEIPAIRTVPISDNKKLYDVFENLESYNWIVFTSPTGVNIFFEAMKNFKLDIRKLKDSKIAAIGEGTSNMLLNRGIYADLIPKIYEAEELGKELNRVCKSGDRILIPRAKNGNPKLVEQISQNRKIEILDIPIYETECIYSKIIDERYELETGNVDFVVFTSASTVNGFVKSTTGLDYTKVKAICIGKHTESAAHNYNMKTYISDNATEESIISLILKLYSKNKF